MATYLADVIVFVHFLIISFCVLGEVEILIGVAFKWRWIRNFGFRLIHLGVALFVAGEAILGITCPLTEPEYNLRMEAGQHTERQITFVGRLIRSIIFYDFPPWVFTMMYVGFGAVILLTFLFIRPRNQQR
jgi:hypothetical protein